jgi:hypothetical protein
LLLPFFGQEPFVIAAGAIRTRGVPIRTIATSVSVLPFPIRPNPAEFLFLLQAFTAIKFKPLKGHK